MGWPMGPVVWAVLGWQCVWDGMENERRESVWKFDRPEERGAKEEMAIKAGSERQWLKFEMTRKTAWRELTEWRISGENELKCEQVKGRKNGGEYVGVEMSSAHRREEINSFITLCYDH